METLLQTLRVGSAESEIPATSAPGVFDLLDDSASLRGLAPELKKWAIPYANASASLEGLCLQTYELPTRPNGFSDVQRDDLVTELQHSIGHLERFGRKLEKSGYLREHRRNAVNVIPQSPPTEGAAPSGDAEPARLNGRRHSS